MRQLYYSEFSVLLYEKQNKQLWNTARSNKRITFQTELYFPIHLYRFGVAIFSCFGNVTSVIRKPSGGGGESSKKTCCLTQSVLGFYVKSIESIVTKSKRWTQPRHWCTIQITNKTARESRKFSGLPRRSRWNFSGCTRCGPSLREIPFVYFVLYSLVPCLYIRT